MINRKQNNSVKHFRPMLSHNYRLTIDETCYLSHNKLQQRLLLVVTIVHKLKNKHYYYYKWILDAFFQQCCFDSPFYKIFEDAGYAWEIQSMTSCFISKDKEKENNDILIFHETVQCSFEQLPLRDKILGLILDLLSDFDGTNSIVSCNEPVRWILNPQGIDDEQFAILFFSLLVNK